MSKTSAQVIRSAQIGMLVNAALAIVKLVAGLVGNTYALVADAVEIARHNLPLRPLLHAADGKDQDAQVARA